MLQKGRNEHGEFRHLSSNDPVTFFAQILSVAVIIFVLSSLIFVYSIKDDLNIVTIEPGVVPIEGLTDEMVSEGVDESNFTENLNGEVDPSKLENLFPDVR